jgi:WD40 repeat protein
VSAVTFFRDGRRIVTASMDKTLRIWDVEKRASVEGSFEGHSDSVYSVSISPDDRQIASGGEDKAMIIWDVDSKQMIFKPLEKRRGWVRSVCFSPDGKKLASGSHDERVIIWDLETGAVLSRLGNDHWVCCIAFSPDGLKLAAGSLRCIRVWHADNAELLLDINIDAHYLVNAVVWTPDSQQLVSASDNTTIEFWDSSNGTQIGQPCTGHTDKICSLTISSDGSFIATASFDKTVRLWSTKSHQQIGQALEHITRVLCVAISPNGELLASGDNAGNLHIWSIESTLSGVFGMDSSYFAHRSKVELSQKLYAETLSDADKVIELNPSSHLGCELKHEGLHGVQCYGDAFEACTIVLSNLNDAPDSQIRQLHQQYISLSEVEDAIRQAIHARLENAPLRLINTSTGRLCNRDAQINAFIESTECKELLNSSNMHGPLQTELIKEAATKYFSWIMLSHRWESKKSRLRAGIYTNWIRSEPW